MCTTTEALVVIHALIQPQSFSVLSPLPLRHAIVTAMYKIGIPTQRLRPAARRGVIIIAL